MFKEEVIQICSKYISIVQEILLQNGTYRIKRMDFSWSCMKCGSMLGVANGTSENFGRILKSRKRFWQVSKSRFLHGLFLLFLSLESFYQRVSGSDF